MMNIKYRGKVIPLTIHLERTKRLMCEWATCPNNTIELDCKDCPYSQENLEDNWKGKITYLKFLDYTTVLRHKYAVEGDE